MSTKKCRHCGWELSKKSPDYICPVCKRAYTEGLCRVCGEYKYDLRTHQPIGVCSDCYVDSEIHQNRLETNANYYWRTVEHADTTYKEWINKLPKVFTPLTEKEWIRACTHFGGCAYCGSEHIEVRSLFIKRRDGGRYHASNVLPACEVCHRKRRREKNPFIKILTLYTGNDNFARLPGILEYLSKYV